MASIDLNIVDRGTCKTEWTAGPSLTPADLDKVGEQRTDSSGALNSLPTPFARFFVAREAFRRATEEYINPNDAKKEAGKAYRQIVSDILDVYELLFNINYHRNTWKSGQKLEVREWNADSNLPIIQSKMPKLYNSLADYYNTDIGEAKLYFVVYTEHGKDILLACSSPITGFVTPPDMDKTSSKDKESQFAGSQYTGLHIHRKSGGEYFRGDPKLFGDRDKEFKNYMFNCVFGSGNIDSRFKEIKNYIFSFRNDSDIVNDTSLSLIPVCTDQNADLVINGLGIKASNEIDVNSFFEPVLIKVPYRISRQNFEVVTFRNDVQNRDYDFLLPFTHETLTQFAENEIDSYVSINKKSVTVYLRHNGKEYSKTYSDNPIGPNDGTIKDCKEASLVFDLGIFPNILSPIDAQNNYFKIMVVGVKTDPEASYFNIKDLNLRFYKNGRQIQERKEHEAEYGVLPAVIRSKKLNLDSQGGTRYYELFNSTFDAIEVDIPGAKGLILPRFEKSTAGNGAYTYAVDLGTSNTFISRTKAGASTTPEMFKMLRPMVNYLHESSNDEQTSVTKRIEDSIFPEAKNSIKTEFAPAFIDGKVYSFPIRTVLCGVRGRTDQPRLFDNHNIAFFYEKTMPDDCQQIFTDIKWVDNSDKLRVFIRELLLIIKTDVLQHNGDLHKTNIVWFRPLSFMANIQRVYDSIWNEEVKNILGVDIESIRAQVSCFSESEAPYYYFKKEDLIRDSDAVSIIDIGGGSTDFVYFQENKPVMANSVHFGCDVLWGNGFNEFEDKRENGIFRRYENSLRFPNREDLDSLNKYFKIDKANKTNDIINFWLGHDKDCDINNKLDKDFKPLFVYHLTAILFYMASMYKDLGYMAPRSVIFSGNGSRYIDNFISTDRTVLRQIINLTFKRVFGGEHNIKLELPIVRKEATCYGGLYRDANAPGVPEKVYQGDVSRSYEKVGEINSNLIDLQGKLKEKYDQMNDLYNEVLEILKRQGIIDQAANIKAYVDKVKEDMVCPLRNYYISQIKDKYDEDVPLKDSVFFLPIIDRVFNLTKLNVK